MTTARRAPVSVVMPAYGHADYIVASLESVLAQDPPPREVIVVDDSSPDDTAARVAPLAADGRVRYVRQPNAGMAAARNAGARLATSEYLYFLDDDDQMYPGALAWLVDALERHPEAAMACGDKVVFEDRPLDVAVPAGIPESAPANKLRFMAFNPIGSPGQTLIRRRAFLEVGGFDPTIWGTDDWDLWLRLLERHTARTSPRPVLAYRVHAHNASRNIARMYTSSLRVARRHLRGFPPEVRVVMRYLTYRALRAHHDPRLRDMMASSARDGRWRLVADASRALATTLALDVAATAALKAHLAPKGRWRLNPDDPILRAASLGLGEA